ncbi:MAG: hypothetical protein HPY85_02875 [Anaerolineae bacterium]|nr:hypothetical protein [Anaerolineae bacterium]
MEQLSKMIAKKVGISEEQAEQAIRMVLNFLADKLPPAIGDHLEDFLDQDTDGKDDSGFGLDDAASLLGGFLNKKK